MEGPSPTTHFGYMALDASIHVKLPSFSFRGRAMPRAAVLSGPYAESAPGKGDEQMRSKEASIL